MWVLLLTSCTAAPEGPATPADAVVSAVSAEALAAASQVTPGATRPPILWISLDTTRADRLEVYGGRARTPALATLARTAVVYDHVFTAFSETGLAHWALMTGVLPEVHGNVPAAGDSMYIGPTIAELAHNAGYKTAAFIGGVTMQANATGLQRGFDNYDDKFAGSTEDMKRSAVEVSALATTWIAGQTDPWFAFVHLFDAHFPYTPADGKRYDPEYRGVFDGSEASLRPFRDDGRPMDANEIAHVRALYDAEITEMDEALAPLLAAAPADAIITVTADHGESFEHGYLFNHRGSLGDEVMHVPWILRAPGVDAGRVDAPVSGVDVLPTLVKAAGWTVNAPFMGHSVLPPVTTAGPVWARTDGWEVFPMARGWTPPLLVARTDRWKVVWTGDGKARAFDLVADPQEDTEVAVPAELADAKAAYTSAIAAMAPWQKPVTTKRTFAAGDGAMLEALGYSVPKDAPNPREPGGNPGDPAANPGDSAPSPGDPAANPPRPPAPNSVPAPAENGPPFIPPAPGGPQGRAPGTPGPHGAIAPTGPPDRSGAEQKK